tara:strand:- start:1725 stop:2045 length:321 start_codon:yes stop_codon:yes gene_type:complete
MPLSKKEKIQMIMDLSATNKKKIISAITKAQQSGQGLSGEGFWSSLGEGLKDIVIALGPTLIKEVLVPVVKKKVGFGASLAGGGPNLSGKPTRGRGRPSKASLMEM